jgi:hypothetical protein
MATPKSENENGKKRRLLCPQFFQQRKQPDGTFARMVEASAADAPDYRFPVGGLAAHSFWRRRGI